MNTFACLVLHIYTTQSSFDHCKLKILMWYRSSSMHTVQAGGGLGGRFRGSILIIGDERYMNSVGQNSPQECII